MFFLSVTFPRTPVPFAVSRKFFFDKSAFTSETILQVLPGASKNERSSNGIFDWADIEWTIKEIITNNHPARLHFTQKGFFVVIIQIELKGCLFY
jgi:hypothetical protein